MASAWAGVRSASVNERAMACVSNTGSGYHGEGSKAREGLVGGLLVGVRSGEDDALDGEQALGDLAEGDLDGVQAGVETCVVLAHVGAEFACRLVSSSNGVPTRGDGPRVRPLRR